MFQANKQSSFTNTRASAERRSRLAAERMRTEIGRCKNGLSSPDPICRAQCTIQLIKISYAFIATLVKSISEAKRQAGKAKQNFPAGL